MSDRESDHFSEVFRDFLHPRNRSYGLQDLISQTDTETRDNLIATIVLQAAMSTDLVGQEYGGLVQQTVHERRRRLIDRNPLQTRGTFIPGEEYIDMMSDSSGAVSLAAYRVPGAATAAILHAHPVGLHFLPSIPDLKTVFTWGRAIPQTELLGTLHRLPLYGIIQTVEPTTRSSRIPFQLLLLQDLLAPTPINIHVLAETIFETFEPPQKEDPLSRKNSQKFREYLETLKRYSIAAEIFKGVVIIPEDIDKYLLKEPYIRSIASNRLGFNTNLYQFENVLK